MNVLVAVLTLFVFNDAAWLAPGLRGDLPPWGPVAPPPWSAPPPSAVFRRPMDAMVDLTNDLGVAILQEYSHSRSNFAFSPYGLASVLVVLYEGAKGESARQIHVAGRFPWDRDITRIGFRDIHRHLRSYFSHEGYLSGITLNKEKSSLNSEYKRVLRYYGYDVDLDSPKPSTQRPMQQIPVVTRPTKPKEVTTLGTPAREDDAAIPTFAKTTTKAPEKDQTNPPTTVTPKLTTTQFFEPTTVKNTVSSTTETQKDSSTTKSPVTESQTEVPTVSTAKSPVTKSQTKVPTLSTTKSPVTESQTEVPTLSTTKFSQLPSETPTVSPKETTTSLVSTTLAVAQDRIDFDVTDEIDSTSTVDSETVKYTKMTEAAETSTSDASVDKVVSTAAAEVETTANAESLTTTLTPETTSTIAEDMLTFPATTVKVGTTQVPDLVEKLTSTVFPATTVGVTTMMPETSAFQGTSTFVAETMAGVEATQVIPVETTQGDLGDTTILGVVDNGMLVPQPAAKDDEPELSVNADPSTVIEEENIRKRSPDVEIRTLDEYMLATKPVQPPIRELVLPDSGNFVPKTLEEFLMGREELTNFVPKTLDELLLAGPVAQFGTSVAFKRFRPRARRTIADILHLPTVPDLSLQLQNGMFDSHVSRKAELYRPLPRQEFLVDAVSETPVPVMTYTNVFPFAYIPRLHSTALEFPLDDERYKLLIILPMERRGLRQLTYDLSAVTLRGVMDALRPSRVKATVPTFMVEGFVILTPALQRLGIWDVFEPRRANLTGMSSDPELYVRNVEQSVTVVIRNYVEILDIQTRTMAARGVEHEFVATHPFLYFVLDTETNVSLMAGQMLDPLNSRVY